MGFGRLDLDDEGLYMVSIVMIVVVIVTHVLNPDDIVFAMMGVTVYLWMMVAVLAVLVESGWMAVVARFDMMPRWRRRRHLYHLWVMVSLKLWVRKRMHLLLHCSRSLTVPYFLLCESSWVRCGPIVGVPLVTSDEIETLATGLIPCSRASFFDFDAADDLGPAHAVRRTFFRGRECGDLDLRDADE